METERGKGMNLAGLWRNSYFTGVHPLTPWTPGMSFAAWWDKAKHDFDDARATSVYRYQLPAFADLYGVDFDRITDAQARELDDRIFAHYQNPSWLYHVVTERANIELMFNDPYWDRLEFKTDYPFGVLVFNVTTLVSGFHPSEFKQASDDPYRFARAEGLKVESLDDYLVVLDRLFQKAKAAGAVCLKTTLAYQRTLRFENVPKDRAARVFGHPRSELSAAEIKDFEDFIMWRLVELERPVRPAVPDPHRPRADPGLQPDEPGRPDRGQPAHQVHPVPRRLSLGRRDGHHPDAAPLPRLARLGLDADLELRDGQAGVPRVARRHALQPDHVGRRRQPRRGDLRRHRDDPALPGRGAGREGRPRRSARRARAARSAARSSATTPWRLFPQLKDRLWKHKGITMKPPTVAVPQAPPR